MKPSSTTVTWWVAPCHSRTRMVPVRGSGSCRGRGCLGCIIPQDAGEQPIQLLGNRSGEATLMAFLPRIGDAECKHVTSKGRRWPLAKLLRPECTQLGA